MMNELMEKFLPCCGGSHDPDPPESFVDFRGHRFALPFLCICCGKKICGRQFAFGRACGVCDIGACNSVNSAYRVECAHSLPEWWHPHGQEMLRRFIEFVNAEPLEIDDG